MSPRARKVQGQPRPSEVLVAWAQSSDPARRAAATALRERLPTPARVLAGECSGLLLDPRSIGEFDAEGTGLGPALMLGASWDGYKRLGVDS